MDDVIVIDDGSDDKTAKISSERGVKVISHSKNKGVGAAFQTGINEIQKLKCDITVNIDADGQFNPDDIEKLILPIADNEADFVTASRFIEPKLKPKMTIVKYYGNKFMSWLISLIIKEKFYDVSCGFRAYNLAAIQRLNLFGQFTYTQETFLDLAFKGCIIKEVPIKVKGVREIGKSRVASNLFKYALQTSIIIIKTLRDYKPSKLFGFIGLIFFLFALGLGSFLIIFYLNNGSFTPHKWAGFLSGFFIIISLMSFFLGFFFDVFSRMRHNQDKILNELRKKY